nr:MAG TPA: hypothetical protein [Caudoviricetes sp.]
MPSSGTPLIYHKRLDKYKVKEILPADNSVKDYLYLIIFLHL